MMNKISQYVVANNDGHIVFIHDENLGLLGHDDVDGELTPESGGTYSVVFDHLMQVWAITGLSLDLAKELLIKDAYIGKMVSGDLVASVLNISK